MTIDSSIARLIRRDVSTSLATRTSDKNLGCAQVGSDAIHDRRKHRRCLGKHVELERLLSHCQEKLPLASVPPKITISMARTDVPKCLFAIQALEARLKEDSSGTVIALREFIVAERSFHIDDDAAQLVDHLTEAGEADKGVVVHRHPK